MINLTHIALRALSPMSHQLINLQANGSVALRAKGLRVATRPRWVQKLDRQGRRLHHWVRGDTPAGPGEEPPIRHNRNHEVVIMRQSEDEQLRARAYAVWEREGCPDGKSEEHWLLAMKEMAGQPAPPRDQGP
jgi:hypothetical protein